MTTKIEWTEETWNPVTGCSRVSEGCRFCYAETLDRRFATRNGHEFRPWTGPNAEHNVRLNRDRLMEPFKWKGPKRVFVNSMSDLFHEKVPSDFIEDVFAIMAATPQHTYQILTKRPKRMLDWISTNGLFVAAAAKKYGLELPEVPLSEWWPLKNVWLGVSVENQQAANERIPLLLQTPSVVRFLSCEPLLGHVDLTGLDLGWKRTQGYGNRRIIWDALTGWEHQYSKERSVDGFPNSSKSQDHPTIDWVIAGGESGPNARAMHPEWVRGLRDQCIEAGVPFFFKQWGSWAPWVDDAKYTHGGSETARNAQTYLNADGTTGLAWIYDDDGTYQNCSGTLTNSSCIMSRVGKKAAGRVLDGRVWDQYPQIEALGKGDCQ